MLIAVDNCNCTVGGAIVASDLFRVVMARFFAGLFSFAFYFYFTMIGAANV